MTARRQVSGELWSIVRIEWARLVAGLGLLLVSAACRLAQPWIVMLAIDRNLRVGGSPGGYWSLIWWFIACAAVESLARLGQQLLVESAGQRALLRLRARLFERLQRLPAAFVDRTPIGRLVGRVTTDVEALQELFSAGVVTILGDLVFLIAAVWLMLSLSVPLTGVTMLMVPVLVLVTIWVRQHARSAYSMMRSKLSLLNAELHEQVSGMAVVQMFGQEEKSAQRFGIANAGVRDSQISSMTWESVLSAATELAGSLTIALILWYGGGLALEPTEGSSAALSLGVLFAFVDYMQRFFVPLNDLSLKYTVMQNALVASDRIFGLLSEPIEKSVVAAPAGSELSGDCAVEFRDVQFAYEAGNPSIRGVSFRVRKGEKVAVVGATGSGKSTLLKLLTRCYELDEGGGCIGLSGDDIRGVPLDELRRRVGVVPQESFLLHGTILDNIRVGQPRISDQAAIAAANRLGLGDVVRRFPNGYFEPVAERGKNLSAGERQLIAFARMLVRAPEVLLLDEATSNVDSQTEHFLRRAVDCLMEQRTSIVVAHRLATIQDADRILVLHRGEIVEQGSHDELLRVGDRGVYAKLHRLQFAP